MKPVLILAVTCLYLISPIDFCPDFLPIIGQADDLLALILGGRAAYQALRSEDPSPPAAL